MPSRWPRRWSRRTLVAPALAGLLLASGSGGPASASSLAPVSPSAGASPASLPRTTGPIVGGEALAGTGTLTDLASGVPAPPAPHAVSWLVADLTTRSIIAAHDVHARLAPASTMKIFTALALAPRLDRKAVYTASEAATAVDGTKVGLVAQSRYTVDQLLHGMIMSSGNDCAVALGELSGGQASAIALIQAEARSLGALDTSVATTSGLDAPGQASSAYDLALAGSEALKNTQISAIMTTRAFAFPAAGKGLGSSRKTFSIQTHNKLIYNTPGATGVKNGYTVAARGSFVGSATRGGHSYLAVVLRTEGSTWHATNDLLGWAFSHGEQAGPVGTLITPAQAAALTAGAPLTARNGTAGPAGSAGSADPAQASAELRGARPAAAAQALSPQSLRSGLSGRTRDLVVAALVAGLLLIAGAGTLLLRPAGGRPRTPPLTSPRLTSFRRPERARTTAGPPVNLPKNPLMNPGAGSSVDPPGSAPAPGSGEPGALRHTTQQFSP